MKRKRLNVKEKKIMNLIISVIIKLIIKIIRKKNYLLKKRWI
jgi:hypothetical protein